MLIKYLVCCGINYPKYCILCVGPHIHTSKINIEIQNPIIPADVQHITSFETLTGEAECEKREQLHQKRAEIARCWIKYCLNLLQDAKKLLEVILLHLSSQVNVLRLLLLNKSCFYCPLKGQHWRVRPGPTRRTAKSSTQRGGGKRKRKKNSSSLRFCRHV